jgi:hypothetical protein
VMLGLQEVLQLQELHRCHLPPVLPVDGDLQLSALQQEVTLLFGAYAGVEIRGHPIVRDHHFLGKDNHVLTNGSPSDDLIFALIIVLCEEGPLSFGQDYHVIQIW